MQIGHFKNIWKAERDSSAIRSDETLIKPDFTFHSSTDTSHYF